MVTWNNKQLLAKMEQEALNDWPQEKQWVLFPKTLNVPQGKAENIQLFAKAQDRGNLKSVCVNCTLFQTLRGNEK